MSISRPSGGRWRKAAIVVATSVAFLAPGLSGGPASAVVDQAAAACPDAFPVADLTTGMEVSGLTVEKGTTPDPFTAKVVGVIENGIGPDVDMIIVDADSPALQRAGGIWAGMSGSPVYAPDGRLVGAVAYGLSNGPSKIAGVTPAADMKAVLSRPAAKLRPASKVALTPAIKQRLVKSGALTATQAAAGMRPLPTPLGVSGVNSAHMSKVAERLEKQAPGTRVYAAGAAPTGPVASPSDIFPGSNFAAAISYGDFSAVGVGTTTAVCSGDVALAFGHPFLFSGPSSMSVHPATAVYVQADPVAAPFKVANPGGPVGTLDQDRLAAIRAKLGPLPASVPVTSKVTATDDGTSREATTQVNVPSFIPNVSALHMLQNLDRVLDRIGAGSSDIRWEVSGTRASGAPFSVDVHNLYASPDDVTSASVGDSADQLFAIANNSLEDAKITGVKYTGSVSNTFTQYSIKSVLVRLPSGQLVPAPTDQPLEVAAGSRLNVRVVLQPYRTPGTVRNVDLSVVVPAGTVGGQGMVDVVGGPGAADDPDAPAEEPASFDELLTQLRGLVPNNAVSATLDVFNDTPAGPVHKQTVARLTELERHGWG